jgi:hypothetical protein
VARRLKIVLVETANVFPLCQAIKALKDSAAAVDRGANDAPLNRTGKRLMLTWVHCGDLHISQEEDYTTIPRLKTLADEANRYLADAVDFVFLPGDNANNGTAEQYRRMPVPDTCDSYRVIVRAQSGKGGSDEDRIDVLTPSAAALVERADALPGTDAHAVDAWPAHGIVGSQLGPNKYGRKW